MAAIQPQCATPCPRSHACARWQRTHPDECKPCACGDTTIGISSTTVLRRIRKNAAERDPSSHCAQV